MAFPPLLFLFECEANYKIPPQMVKEPKSDTLTRLGGFYSSEGPLDSATPNADTVPGTQAALGSRFQAPRKGPSAPGPCSDPALSGSNLNRQGSGRSC